jgi:DNA-directed RNA polymerase specialized sigma24 family protein
MTTATTSELCVRLRQRDVTAFNALVAGYQNELRRALIALGYRSRTADDLVQAAFVRAFERHASCPEPGLLVDWLCGLALEVARAARIRPGTRAA